MFGIGLNAFDDAGSRVNVSGSLGSVCGAFTRRIRPRCSRIENPALVAGASMLAVSPVGATLATFPASDDDTAGDATPDAVSTGPALPSGVGESETTPDADANPDGNDEEDELADGWWLDVQPATSRVPARIVTASTRRGRGTGFTRDRTDALMSKVI
jgi:hypothetical protein